MTHTDCNQLALALLEDMEAKLKELVNLCKTQKVDINTNLAQQGIVELYESIEQHKETKC